MSSEHSGAVLQQFDAHRPRLAAIALRMLGSPSDADDAVQDVWLRVAGAQADVTNVGGWLTTITARICLDMLRSRRSRREDPFDVVVPDTTPIEAHGPDEQVILADSVSLALLVVLEALDPRERLAFVLHDMFAVSFEEIAPLIERTPTAARQLASRARKRVQVGGPAARPPLAAAHRQVLDAFFAAARGGDFEGLVAVLATDVTLKSDGGAGRPQATTTVVGARDVAGQALRFAQPGATLHPVLVSGRAGVLVTVGVSRISLMAFTVDGERIHRIDCLVDPARLALLDPSIEARTRS